jgi:solute carrier family 10 (sodium/bile acid cotransporter), member 7
MRRALSRIPLDTFLFLLIVVIVLATLLPARGAAADVLSVATKAAVALLFALSGARCRSAGHLTSTGPPS